ncbi:MAG: hypothetical protein ACLT98_08245 [Eggerthellaceae bacterium]
MDRRAGQRGPDINWQLDDSIKLLTDDELTYTTWHVENGKPTFERHGVDGRGHA